MPNVAPYLDKKDLQETFRVLAIDRIPQRKRTDSGLTKKIIRVAPTANVYQISSDQKDLADNIKNTLPYFNYFLVELGLDVLLEKGSSVPELLFEANLRSDRQYKTDVTAYDISPNDTIKHVTIASGKVSLNITKLLEFVFSKVGVPIVSPLSIDINPITFEWGYDKYRIDAAGKKNYNVHWKIYDTPNVQAFNPTVMLKARKDVKTIDAYVKATYKLRTSLFHSDIRTTTRKVPILT